MEKDKIFFAENGLTTTSANHIANIAKERYQTFEKSLEDITFITNEVSLLGSSKIDTLRVGVGKDTLNELKDNLLLLAQYKSLIAWLREAIKAKERMIHAAQILSDAAIAKTLGIELPIVPESEQRLTEDDVVATWNIKQRNRYYYVETLCSTFGKYIHPEGSLSVARNDLIKAISEPTTVNGSGRDMVIYYRKPSVEIVNVEKTFFELQNEYREYQAELNSMKHQIEVTLQEDDREKTQREKIAYNNYASEREKIQLQILEARKELVRQAQSLKITIPDSLKPVYEVISKLGK